MNDSLGDKIEGQAHQIGGKVQEEVGEATNNPNLQRQGETNQAQGHAQQAVGNVKDAANNVKNTVENALGGNNDNPR